MLHHVVYASLLHFGVESAQRKINLPHDLDGKRARNLSCRMSPHSVGNEE
jgi:hypothetical protein